MSDSQIHHQHCSVIDPTLKIVMVDNTKLKKHILLLFEKCGSTKLSSFISSKGLVQVNDTLFIMSNCFFPYRINSAINFGSFLVSDTFSQFIILNINNILQAKVKILHFSVFMFYGLLNIVYLSSSLQTTARRPHPGRRFCPAR